MRKEQSAEVRQWKVRRKLLGRKLRPATLFNGAAALLEKVGHTEIPTHIVLPLVGNSATTIKTEL